MRLLSDWSTPMSDENLQLAAQCGVTDVVHRYPGEDIAVLRADRVVAGMEEAYALIRRERGMMPRAVNMISGPSRTGDIEQTIVLGAHGPFRVHILVLT